VIKVINWYKKYRYILNADIIHLRRADGRDWDGWMHVSANKPSNAEGKDQGQKLEKGLVMLFNPTDKPMTRQIKLPLYYTGLTKTARIREKEGLAKVYTLNRDYEVTLPVTLAPNAYSWWVIE